MAELTTDQKLELALNDPHPVTVGGLNKVYRYIMSRISNSSSSGSAFYKIQGDVESFTELLSLGTITETNDEPVTAGIIYNVKGADPTGATGVNYVCVRQYRIVNNNYQSKVYKTAREAGNIIYDPTKIYYLKVGENEWQVISNPDPELFNADTWYLFVFVDYQAGGVQVTTSNITDYYNHFWDSFGGSQPPASKSQLGVVKIGDNINVSDGKISVKTANGDTLGLVKQGENTEIDSGAIRVPYANESGSNNTTKCGVLKVGDKISYDSSTHTINLSAGNAIKIGSSVESGETAGQIEVLYDNTTIQKNNSNKLYARTAGPDTLGVVKVNTNNDGTIKVVMTSGENSTSTGELVARTASASTLGVVMNGLATTIGNGGTVDVNVDGTTIEVKDNNLHVLNANGTTLGTVSQGDYVTIDPNGEISANKAGDDFGVVKPIGSSNQLINSDSEVYGVDDSTIKIDTTNKYIYVDKSSIINAGTNTSIDSNRNVNVTSLILGDTSEASTLITVTNDSSTPAVSITGKKDIDNTEPTSTTCALYVDGNIRSEGNISGSKVFHAVWNDISDAIEVQDDLEVEPGFCYMFDGKTYKKTEEYCQKGVLGIHSDTAGDILGRKGKHKELDIAIGGFVLAHVDDIYESGTPLTCGPDGCLTEMKREDVREYPERLIATYWRPESEEFWGPEDSKIAVNGRDWVKVK